MPRQPQWAALDAGQFCEAIDGAHVVRAGEQVLRNARAGGYGEIITVAMSRNRRAWAGISTATAFVNG